MDNKLIGLGVFIAAYIAARMINERALRNLEEEDAGRLLGGFQPIAFTVWLAWLSLLSSILR